MRELKAGDKVWLRDDLLHGVEYGATDWVEEMCCDSLEKVTNVYLGSGCFEIKDGDSWDYTLEMIDWDKTHKMWEEQELNNKKETIVMPKIFDDWVKKDISHGGKDHIYNFVCSVFERGVSDELLNFYNENPVKCYRALLDGYEVKEEQFYTVDIGCNKGLVKIANGSISLALDYKFWDMSDKALTQSEIENSEHGILMAIAEKVVM